jgi:hypothetical protein
MYEMAAACSPSLSSARAVKISALAASLAASSSAMPGRLKSTETGAGETTARVLVGAVPSDRKVTTLQSVILLVTGQSALSAGFLVRAQDTVRGGGRLFGAPMRIGFTRALLFLFGFMVGAVAVGGCC